MRHLMMGAEVVDHAHSFRKYQDKCSKSKTECVWTVYWSPCVSDKSTFI